MPARAPGASGRWAASGPRPLLSASEAHVWLLDPAPAARPPGSGGGGLLAAPERVRLGRLRSGGQPEGHTQVLATSLLARAALTRAVPDVEPGDWRITRSRRGRPELVGPAVDPPVRLSMSHDSSLVACLLVVDTDCGVDVEEIEQPGERDPAFDEVAARAERALGSCPDGLRRWVRCSAWALHEAHSKALGAGRAMDPLRRPVVWDGVAVRMVLPPAERGTWRHDVLPAGDRHVLAVAIREPVPERQGPSERHLVVHTPAESVHLMRSLLGDAT